MCVGACVKGKPSHVWDAFCLFVETTHFGSSSFLVCSGTAGAETSTERFKHTISTLKHQTSLSLVNLGHQQSYQSSSSICLFINTVTAIVIYSLKPLVL